MSGLAVAQNILRFLTDSGSKFHFVVSIDGILSGGFKSCDGIKESIETFSIKECNRQINTTIDTNVTTSPITLSQGVAIGDSIYSWYKKCRDWTKGEEDPRRNVSIVQLKYVYGLPIEVDRYDYYNCKARIYNGVSFDSKSEDESISSIIITTNEKLDKPLDVLSGVSDVASVAQTYAKLISGYF